MKVTIEEIIKITERLKEINHAAINDIEVYQDGEQLEISKEDIERWVFVGLGNVDFIKEKFIPQYRHIAILSGS